MGAYEDEYARAAENASGRKGYEEGYQSVYGTPDTGSSGTDWRGVVGSLMVGGSQGWLQGKQQQWAQEAADMKKKTANRLRTEDRRWAVEDRDAKYGSALAVENAKQAGTASEGALNRAGRETVAGINATGRSSKSGGKTISGTDMKNFQIVLKDVKQEYLDWAETQVEAGWRDDKDARAEKVAEMAKTRYDQDPRVVNIMRQIGAPETPETQPRMIDADSPSAAIAILGKGSTPPLPESMTIERTGKSIEVKPDGVIGQMQDKESLVRRAAEGDESAIEELRLSDARSQLNADAQRRSIMGKLKEFSNWSSSKASGGKPIISGIYAEDIAKRAGLPPEAAKKLAMPEYIELAYAIDEALNSGDKELLEKLLKEL